MTIPRHDSSSSNHRLTNRRRMMRHAQHALRGGRANRGHDDYSDFFAFSKSPAVTTTRRSRSKYFLRAACTDSTVNSFTRLSRFV